MVTEIASLFLEPLQLREIAPLLREATLTGKGLLADIVRTPAGIRLTIGTLDQRQWRAIRKILDAPTEPKPKPSK